MEDIIMKKKILPIQEEHLTKETRHTHLGLFLALVLSAQAIFAGAKHTESTLHLSLWNHSDFIVEFDGERYPASCDFVLDGIEAGQHRLRVYSKVQHGAYGNGGRVIIHYNGCIDIPASAKLIAQINSRHELKMKNIGLTRPPQPIRPRPAHGYSYGNEGDACSDYHHTQGAVCGTSASYQGHGYDYPEHEYGTYGMHSFTDDQLEHLMTEIENSWNDEVRVKIARQAIENSSIRSGQVKEIMDTFWFDDNKLDFAKFAYSHVSDPYNFYIVNSSFRFNSSIQKLDDFIHGLNG